MGIARSAAQALSTHISHAKHLCAHDAGAVDWSLLRLLVWNGCCDRQTYLHHPVTWYEISALGIDRIEGGSEYEPKDRYPGINVNATGTNVITLGDGKVVNAKFSELRDQLDNLKSEIASSSALTDKQKLDVTVDIESVKDQLAKETPDTTIVKHLWAGIDHVAKVAGLVEAVHKILPYIEHLM
jgi:hypothetical protein